MTEIQDATLEGRLLAQRQVLAELLAACDRAGGPLSEWVRSFVADDFGPRDYAEDPGALPDAAFAVESVIAQGNACSRQRHSASSMPTRAASAFS